MTTEPTGPAPEKPFPTPAAGTDHPQSSPCRLAWLFQPMDIAVLAYFRVVFGAIMIWEISNYFTKDWIYFHYVVPPFHFTYYGFGWVQVMPASGMFILFFQVGVAAFCMMIGLLYRLNAILFFFGFSYIFLLEKATYLNHYYLVCLIAFLMIFLPAHRAFSLDALMRPQIRTGHVPAWTVWILRFQIGVPYFFGGIAKLNTDWLRGRPLDIWLGRSTEKVPYIGQFFTEDWMVFLFAYGGVMFDLAIVPLLLWRRTRAFAFCAAVLFHGLNFLLYNIGIFPWLMTFGTLVFFLPDWPRRFLRLTWLWRALRRGLPKMPESPLWPPGLTTGRKFVVTLLALWIATQVLIPFRHWLYPGNVSWTEEGHRFSWHMMLRTKKNGVRFMVTDPRTGQTFVASLQPYLSSRQVREMGKFPEMIREFAHFLEKQLQQRKEYKGVDLEVRAIALCSVNGRKAQLLIDPTVDLTKYERSLWPQPWIVPLHEPFRTEPWDVPLLEWERSVETELTPRYRRGQ